MVSTGRPKELPNLQFGHSTRLKFKEQSPCLLKTDKVTPVSTRTAYCLRNSDQLSDLWTNQYPAISQYI